MATRGQLRDAVTEELRSVAGVYDVTDAAGNVVESVELRDEDIGLRNPEQRERLPQVVYHEDYVRREFNGVGAAPDIRVLADDGSVVKAIWREYVEAQFIIDVRASNEVVKEPIYEALRSRLAQYQFGPWDGTDIHPDVIDVEVLDSTTVDSGDAEDVIRGDQLDFRVLFHRDYTFTTDNIEAIDTAVDADGDGTTDFTYNTS